MGTWLNGYLVLQGSMPLRTSQFEHVLKLPGRKRLGARWAKYIYIYIYIYAYTYMFTVCV